MNYASNSKINMSLGNYSDMKINNQNKYLSFAYTQIGFSNILALNILTFESIKVHTHWCGLFCPFYIYRLYFSIQKSNLDKLKDGCYILLHLECFSLNRSIMLRKNKRAISFFQSTNSNELIILCKVISPDREVLLKNSTKKIFLFPCLPPPLTERHSQRTSKAV